MTTWEPGNGTRWRFKLLIRDAKPGTRRLYHIYSHSDEHTIEEDLILEYIRAESLPVTHCESEAKTRVLLTLIALFQQRNHNIKAGVGITGSPKGAIYKS